MGNTQRASTAQAGERIRAPDRAPDIAETLAEWACAHADEAAE